MLKVALLVIFYFTFPILLIYLCHRWTVLQKVGAIVLAYAFGLILGSSGLMPKGSDGYRLSLQGRSALPVAELNEMVGMGQATESDILVNHIAAAQDMLLSLIVPLAFPLLLFSLNLKRWLRFAKKGFFSVALAIISGLIMVTAGFFVFKDKIPESWKLAGMFVGIYTGGTPNFVALKMALNVDANLFVIASTYDMVIGAFLVLFFITIAPKFFRLILPPFKNGDGHVDPEEALKETEGLEDYTGFFDRKNMLPLLKAVGLSVLIFATAFGISLLLPSLPQMVVVILTITTLGLLASTIKSINRIEKTFQLGMYFIIVFSLVVASMADLRAMIGIGMANLIMFITWCYFGSMLLHLLLAKIFGIDSDNFLITATAFVFSPPFVPMVANALKNRDVIVTGITGGILGYILGNYFGVLLAYFLKTF